MTIGRRGIVVAATAGVLAAGVRLFHDLNISDVCPEIGVVPVCGIVLVSHAAILGYGAWWPRLPSALFYVGGLPALVFPVLGSFMEAQSPNFCKGTLDSAVPDCFVLAGIAVAILGSFFWLNFGQRERGS